MTERQGLRCPFAADGHRDDKDDKDDKDEKDEKDETEGSAY